MFYLPFEHGFRGQQFLQEFQWLHEKSHFMNSNNLEDRNLWLKRFKDFQSTVNQFNCLYKLIIDSPNKVKMFVIKNKTFLDFNSRNFSICLGSTGYSFNFKCYFALDSSRKFIKFTK